MATNAGGLLIDPNGTTAVVNMTTLAGGAHVIAFFDAACTDPVTFPYTVGITTAFYVKTSQVTRVSIKVNDVEVATPLGFPLVYIFNPGVLEGISVPFNSTLAGQFVAIAGGVVTGNGVSSFNTRAGPITLTKQDVVNTGIAANDVNAVSTAGGGAEGIVISNGVSGSYTPDLSQGNYFVVNLTGNVTVHMPSVANGKAYSFVIHFFQDATGGRTYSWDAAISWLANVTPTMDTTPNGDDLCSFLCESDNTRWFGLHNTAQLTIGNTFLDFATTAEPANPPSGTVRLWYDGTSSKFLFKDFAGVTHDLSSTTSTGGGGGSGTIALVPGQSTQGSTTGTNLTFVLPSAPANGHMVLCAFATEATGTITPPAGWTVDIEYSGTQAIGKVGIYRKTAGGSEPNSYTWTISGSHFMFGFLAEYSGQTATPLDKTQTGEGHSTAKSITTAATSQIFELAITIALTDGNYASFGNVTWGSSGFGTLYDSHAGAVASKALTATDVVTSTVNFPATEYISLIVATYKAA